MKSEYRIIHGKEGKKYYVVTEKMWSYIQRKILEGKFETNIDLIKHISKITDHKISEDAISNWIYKRRSPIVVREFEPVESKDGCKHGFFCFCYLCNINQISPKECPVPLLWVSNPQGKIYAYDQYWAELKRQIDHSHEYGFLSSLLHTKINVSEKTVRLWKNNQFTPKIFTRDHFSFSPHNLYLLGLFLSDGHLRNNGSNLSFTYQMGSSNIFQGYWYPQLIQRILPIFQNKDKLSNTYIVSSDKVKSTALRTNLSSISPIFVKKLLESGLIQKKENSHTSGYQKYIGQIFVEELGSYSEFIQGLFEGDGSYAFSPSPSLELATAPEIDYSALIKAIGLIPTLTSHDHKEFIPYANRKNNSLYMIRFAPGSLKHVANGVSPKDIVRQLETFLDAAHHSIRPDKVYKLIKIINRIASDGYGNGRKPHPFQKEIKELAIKANLKAKAFELEKIFPIRNGKYQPFLPKWAEELCSLEEAWGFFHGKENLMHKSGSKEFIKLNFKEGIPIDFNYRVTSND